MEALRDVNRVKRNFGGRRAFHEKLVTESAKKFLDKPEKIVLPTLDLMYFWNVFQVASGNPDALPAIMNRIEDKLAVFTKDVDIELYSYLTFMKGNFRLVSD